MTKSRFILPWFVLLLIVTPCRPQVHGAVGAVTIDGKIWNQISLRPVIPIWKFGVALDIALYMDAEGNIRKDDWDFTSGKSGLQTIIDKIYYIRYGHPGEPLYGRVGALDNVTIGYGILMSGYSNTMEYPQTKKVGLDLRIRGKRTAIQGMTNDFKEFGGLVAVRGERPLPFGLPLGITIAMDRNQHFGLKDRDRDGYPDLVDDFPDTRSLWLDSDGDGLADLDPLEWDIDGDGITDTLGPDIPGWPLDTIIVLDTYIFKKPNPVNILKDHNAIAAIALDAGIPVYSDKHIRVSIYAQAAQLIGTTTNPESLEKKALGLGLVPLGISARFGPASLNIEYRNTPTGRFEFGYWNRAYELERAVFVQTVNGNRIQTKESRLGTFGPSQGIYGQLAIHIGPLLKADAQYQTMTGDRWNSSLGVFENVQYQNFFSELALAKPISRLKTATLFFQQRNVPNLFDFVPNASTVMGYRLGLSMGSGMTIEYISKNTYKDLNGDGDVLDLNESITITAIETSFAF